MPIVHRSGFPVFTPKGVHITGLASPNRGSRELCVWRVRLEPGTTPEHTLDAEEIFAVLDGSATFRSGETEERVGAGNSIIISPGERIVFVVAEGEYLEAICSMRVGAKATLTSGDNQPFPPPWTLGRGSLLLSPTIIST